MSDPLIGRRLRQGEYELREVLGRGGMAVVYRAYARSLDTDVAIKLLAPRLAGDSGFRGRFREEARSLAHLHHPNLVEVYHHGEEGELVYIVMRLVEGGTLKDRAAALGGPLDLVTTARLTRQVASALEHAHERGLVHLDIKPANVLLGRADWPLLADFGITRAVEREETEGGRERVAGTPAYMSPEQCQGERVDGRSDQYSLAVTAYELLTGRRPFEATTTAGLLAAQVGEAPPNPRQLNPGIPGPVEAVLLRGLAKDPGERYGRISEFGEALSAAVEQTRGVSLETKAGLAEVAPGVLGVLGLLVGGPLLVSTLPGTVLVGGKVPLAWPFQLVLGVMLALLVVPLRWPVIGLASRGVGQVLSVSGGRGEGTGWRKALVGGIEGVVDLGLLFLLFHLLVMPVLAVTHPFLAAPAYPNAVSASVVVVTLVAFAILLRTYRLAGFGAAGLGFAIFLLAATSLPFGEMSAAAQFSLVGLLVGVAAFAMLLAVRGIVRPTVERIAVRTFGRLLIEADPTITVREAGLVRGQVGEVAGVVVDYGYLVGGFELVRQPLLEALTPRVGELAAAIVLSGVVGVVWLVLGVRLQRLAGEVGLALGVLLGAPLLLAVPVFDPVVLGTNWPATVATWGVGTVLVLVVVALRGPVRTMGQHALGQRLEAGLVGTAGAASEEASARQRQVLEEVVGGLIDVGVLVVGYWALGVPAASVIEQRSGNPEVGSVLLVGLVVAVVGMLLGRMRQAGRTLGETGGGSWGRRVGALPGVLVGVIALLAASCAAVPVSLAAPEAAGAFVPQAVQVPTLLINWDYVLPLTPDPSESTYTSAFSCSDGRVIGQFREAFQPGATNAASLARTGQLGRTQSSCTNWQPVYFALRRAAGLPNVPSLSWNALDERVVINPDGSADVVETHQVLFTYGNFDSLTWNEPFQVGNASNVQVSDDTGPYPLSTNSQSSARYARLWEENGQTRLGWWFPSVASPAERTFVVRYHLIGAVQNVGGQRQFVRSILVPPLAGPVWRATVEVVLPSVAQASQVQLGESGFPARQGLVDGRTAWFAADDVPRGANLTVQVGFP